ncbi:MAG: hypothetical protein R6U98_24850 [Pirellulaceae bacterium]
MSYPKIVFLYPTVLMSLAAAIYLSFAGQPDTPDTDAVVLSVVFLCVWVTNLVVLGFDFPRATSLSLVFLFVMVVMGCVLLSVLKPILFIKKKETLLTQLLGTLQVNVRPERGRLDRGADAQPQG